MQEISVSNIEFEFRNHGIFTFRLFFRLDIILVFAFAHWNWMHLNKSTHTCLHLLFMLVIFLMGFIQFIVYVHWLLFNFYSFRTPIFKLHNDIAWLGYAKTTCLYLAKFLYADFIIVLNMCCITFYRNVNYNNELFASSMSQTDVF